MKAIKVIKNAKKLNPFEFPQSCVIVPWKWPTELGKKYEFENQLKSIVQKHGSYLGKSIILRRYFLEYEDAKDFVVHFLISDGDKNRVKRNVLLSDDLSFVGIRTLEGNFPKLCTLQFTQKWIPN